MMPRSPQSQADGGRCMAMIPHYEARWVMRSRATVSLTMIEPCKWQTMCGQVVMMPHHGTRDLSLIPRCFKQYSYVHHLHYLQDQQPDLMRIKTRHSHNMTETLLKWGGKTKCFKCILLSTTDIAGHPADIAASNIPTRMTLVYYIQTSLLWIYCQIIPGNSQSVHVY